MILIKHCHLLIFNLAEKSVIRKKKKKKKRIQNDNMSLWYQRNENRMVEITEKLMKSYFE